MNLKVVILAVIGTFAALALYFMTMRDSHPGKERRAQQKITFACQECGEVSRMTPMEFHRRHSAEELAQMDDGKRGVRANCRHCDGKFTAIEIETSVDDAPLPSGQDVAEFNHYVKGSRGVDVNNLTSERARGGSRSFGTGRPSGGASGGRSSAVTSSGRAGGGSSGSAANSASTRAQAVGAARQVRRGEFHFACSGCSHRFSYTPQQIQKVMRSRSGEESDRDASRVPCPSCRSKFGGVLVGN